MQTHQYSVRGLVDRLSRAGLGTAATLGGDIDPPVADAFTKRYVADAVANRSDTELDELGPRPRMRHFRIVETFYP